MSKDHRALWRAAASTHVRPLARVGSSSARLPALLCLAAVILLSLAASGAAANSSPKAEALEQAVVAAMVRQTEKPDLEFAVLGEQARQGQTQVNVKRTSDDRAWAFGTAVILAPHKEGMYPKGWLFVAEETKNGWDIALEGSQEFTDLVQQAPEGVVDKGEKEMFATSTAGSRPIRTRLRLPWRKGKIWRMTGGPHGWARGYDRPYSALDFAGGSQKVRAAGGGRIYKMCASNRGWIRIYHRNGYSTDYYHLRRNVKLRDGRWIKRGAYLGYTGTNTSCGGAAYGRHVHFALLRKNRHVAVDNKTIGGWTFQQGRAYKGYAQRNGIKRYPGDRLRNFGP